jgi:hypothetical protein
VRGEVVLLVAGRVETKGVDRIVSEEEVAARVRSLRAAGLSTRDASVQVAAELGVSKRVAYRLARGGGEAEGGETAE